jgi:pimeloyl-ACP methyl ester carboxylesterase
MSVLPHRSLFTVMAVVATVASGLVAGATASAAPAVAPAPGGYTPPPVTWAACGDRFPVGFECGTVAVPLDWNDVRGRTVTLALTRVRHTVEPYQGVLLVNPGGPGGSGTVYAGLRDAVPNGGGDAYDWIGFDPRGVGDSKPALSCDPGYFNGPRPQYVPTKKSVETSWIGRSKSYAAKCSAKNGALLAHITTQDSVKDMDAIRVALRQEQINYLGFSYGTTLGQTYGTLFPARLRRAIFDSNVDPRSDWYRANLDQDIAFQKVFRVFAGWVAKYDRVYHLGRTATAVERSLYGARDRLDQRPVGRIGGAEFTDALLVAGYAQSVWPDMARGVSRWVVKHDKQALKDVYGAFAASTDDNLYAVYTATTCNESYWPSYSVYRSDSWRVHRVAPFMTWYNSWFNGPCIYWKVPRVAPVQIDGSGVQSALLIDETLDAATPYAGSLETRRRFPHSVLLAEKGGTSHANSLVGNACVDDTIAAYLKSGTLPVRRAGAGADKLCEPLPQPKPTPASTSGSRSGSAKSPLGERRSRTGLAR